MHMAFGKYFRKHLRDPDTAITDIDRSKMHNAFIAGANWERGRIKPRNF